MTNDTTTSTKPVVRYAAIDGQQWLFIADLARLLGLTNASTWIRPISDAEKRTLSIPTSGAPLHVRVINLSGLLKLLFSSEVPAARTLRDRITLDDLKSADPRRLLPDCELVEWDGKTQRLKAGTSQDRVTAQAA